MQTKKALDVMSSAKDPNDYKKSLDMYENAFVSFPDSIDYAGLYNASISASELNLYDKAFGYINGMKRLQKDAYGFPWWDYIACQNAEEDYKHLMSDRRWRVLLRDAVKEKEMFYRNLEKEKKEFFALKEPLPFDNKNIKPLELYKKLKCYNAYLTKERPNYSIIFDINDSTRTSYFVDLPTHYNPDKKYSLLFFLYGAVKYNALVGVQQTR
ncbi:hypothetical protein [Porphyromonas pogonae]|uniref:hypothetical protein n=1 Tax=Porphyromonas pogonae TaxID=867595 RepID=UPI002E782EFD|nr:hypothetical protein [Porphyromonas pogonae]